MLIALPLVTILFLLANFSFFSILSSYDLRHVHSLSLHAGHTVLGQPGGLMMAGTVIASALGSINANIWAGSRLLVILAQDNTIVPVTFSKIWTRRGTTALAMLVLVLQACIHASLSLDFKTFSKIYSAVGWWWYGLSIAGLLYLRRRRPYFPRPVKIWWPLALMFVVMAFFLVVGALTLALMTVGLSPSSSSSFGARAGGNTSIINITGAPSLGDNDKNRGKEGEGNLDGTPGESGDRFLPVIMFAAVAGLMLLIIPAYYGTQFCTKRRKQRLVRKQVRSKAQTPAAAQPMGAVRSAREVDESSLYGGSFYDRSVSGYDSSDSERNRRTSAERPPPTHPYLLDPQQWVVGKQLQLSAASSLTLVDEATGRPFRGRPPHHHHHHRRYRSRHHRHHQHQPKLQPQQFEQGSALNDLAHSLPMMSFPGKESMEYDEEEEEEELMRMQSLHASKLEYNRQHSLDPGGSTQVSSANNSQKSSRRPSVVTLFGSGIVSTGGSNRNGSTSNLCTAEIAEAACAPATGPETGLRIGLGSFVASSSGPQHPFDHPQPYLQVPGSQFCFSPISRPSAPRVQPYPLQQGHCPSSPILLPEAAHFHSSNGQLSSSYPTSPAERSVPVPRSSETTLAEEQTLETTPR